LVKIYVFNKFMEEFTTNSDDPYEEGLKLVKQKLHIDNYIKALVYYGMNSIGEVELDVRDIHDKIVESLIENFVDIVVKEVEDEEQLNNKKIKLPKKGNMYMNAYSKENKDKGSIHRYIPFKFNY